MVEGIFGRDFKVIERALDVRMTRQQMLASDMANIDTPGFRALDVDFGESLGKVMQAEDAQDSEQVLPGLPAPGSADQPGGTPLKVVGVDGLLTGPESNTANLELLMGRLQENSTLYGVTTQMMNAQFRRLRDVLDGVSK
jgi:flagellar basal-body rod protein FlgB